MPVNLNVGALGAVNRPAHAPKSSSKQDPAATEKAKAGDTVQVAGPQTTAPAPAELGLAQARAALASLTRDITARPAAALAAQASVRPRVAIALAG
jgi:hypothetical protein